MINKFIAIYRKTIVLIAQLIPSHVKAKDHTLANNRFNSKTLRVSQRGKISSTQRLHDKEVGHKVETNPYFRCYRMLLPLRNDALQHQDHDLAGHFDEWPGVLGSAFAVILTRGYVSRRTPREYVIARATCRDVREVTQRC